MWLEILTICRESTSTRSELIFIAESNGKEVDHVSNDLAPKNEFVA